MRIGFLGAPYSGKTTTAAKLFANLKDSGIPCEFVPEYARIYIARERFIQRGFDLKITDEHQYDIVCGQQQTEERMDDGKTLVIADSCILNTMLYANHRGVRDLVQKHIHQYHLLFLCGLVPNGVQSDPNRIHSHSESLHFADLLDNLLADFNLPVNDPYELLQTEGKPHVYRLEGDSNTRAHMAQRVVLDYLSR